MFKTTYVAIVAAVSVIALGAAAGWAQQPPPQAPSNITFFVISAGLHPNVMFAGCLGERVFS
jgi:hypothetical protein